MPVISDGVDLRSRSNPGRVKGILYQEFNAPPMIEFGELFYLFAAGAILVVALIAYNKFGKVKDQ